MALLEQIKEQISFLDKKTFYRYLIIFSTLVFIALLGIAYYFYSQQNKLLKQLKTINYNRLETQEILTRYAIVQKQRAIVEDLLTQDKTFFIGQYFADLMNQQKIPSDSYQQQELITEEISENYNQVKLAGSISGIDMKQLVELLHTVEQEERIYVEELEIMHNTKNQKIDVKIVVATLEPKQPQTE